SAPSRRAVLPNVTGMSWRSRMGAAMAPYVTFRTGCTPNPALKMGRFGIGAGPLPADKRTFVSHARVQGKRLQRPASGSGQGAPGALGARPRRQPAERPGVRQAAG